MYRVTVSTDGQVAYEGDYFVERIGRHRGKVDPESVRDLVRFILRLGFDGLEPEYPAVLPACRPSNSRSGAGSTPLA